MYVHGSFCRKIAIWGPIPTTSTLGIKIDGVWVCRQRNIRDGVGSQKHPFVGPGGSST